MKKIIGLIIVVVVVATIALLTTMRDSPTDEHSNNSNGATQLDKADDEQLQSNEIAMTNLSFSPAKITVKKGTTVTWINKDDVQHNVAPNNPTDEFKKSSLFGKDGTYSVTFNTPGEYSYTCTPHPFMKGTVIVTE